MEEVIIQTSIPKSKTSVGTKTPMPSPITPILFMISVPANLFSFSTSLSISRTFYFVYETNASYNITKYNIPAGTNSFTPFAFAQGVKQQLLGQQTFLRNIVYNFALAIATTRLGILIRA